MQSLARERRDNLLSVTSTKKQSGSTSPRAENPSLGTLGAGGVVTSNGISPTCTWGMGRVPYARPGVKNAPEEKLVDLSAPRGAAVRISTKWSGHYPTLKNVPGTLKARAGRGWAVEFEGFQNELFFDVEKGLEQLAFILPDEPSDQQVVLDGGQGS